jgi:hypothetical protein
MFIAVPRFPLFGETFTYGVALPLMESLGELVSLYLTVPPKAIDCGFK